MKKKVFQNGTLKSKAYFMNGETKQEIEEAVWEGTTPLSAENLNGMQDNIEEEINSHIEHKHFLKLTADVAKGGTITIPCYYKVGVGTLDVFYMRRKAIAKQRCCRNKWALSGSWRSKCSI